MQCTTGMDHDDFFTIWRTHHSETGSLTCRNTGCLHCHYPGSCDGWRLHYSIGFWREHLSILLLEHRLFQFFFHVPPLLLYNHHLSFWSVTTSTWQIFTVFQFTDAQLENFESFWKQFFLKNHISSLHSKVAIKKPVFWLKLYKRPDLALL